MGAWLRAVLKKMRYDDYYDYDRAPAKHSALGVMSFVLAIGTGLMMVALLILAAVLDQSHPDAMDFDTPTGKVLSAGFFLALFLALCGVGLGIAGVSQSRRRAVFGIIGLVFNGLIVLGCGCLGLIGMAMEM
jgi:hypothetical protein